MLDFNNTAACGLATARINALAVAAELANEIAEAADRTESMSHRQGGRHYA